MAASAAPAPPLLVLVTGPPASGKTRLAQAISSALGLPLITKDGLKEALFDTLGVGNRDWSKRLGGAAFALMYHMAAAELQVGRSIILEGNFRVGAESDLRGLLARHGARLVQIHTTADAATLLDRFRARWEAGQRHPGHLDDITLSELAVSIREGVYAPLHLDGALLCVDTTAPQSVDVADIIRAVAAVLAT